MTLRHMPRTLSARRPGEAAMTAEELIHHTFPWERAPGVPRDDLAAGAHDPEQRAGRPPRPV
jgi:hypothetical protein